jgi:DNA-binding response OmpR family regulator
MRALPLGEISMQITIVDNDKALLRSLSLLLSKEGHEVVCCQDPLEAAEIVGVSVHPDVLIVDYVMPGLDGVSLLRRVRPRLAEDCSMILISGHSDRLGRSELEPLGLLRFLPKPLDFEELSGLLLKQGGEGGA